MTMAYEVCYVAPERDILPERYESRDRLWKDGARRFLKKLVNGSFDSYPLWALNLHRITILYKRETLPQYDR